MTRVTAKNRINKILRECTSGLFSDEYWQPIHKSFRAIIEAGFDIIITNTQYQEDYRGIPISKVWKFEIAFGNKPIYGVMTAHGAGTVEDPLNRYDISAYVS